MPTDKHRWYEWATQIQATVQGTLAYSTNPFEIERCRKLEALAHEILATYTDTDFDRVQGFFESDTSYATPKVDVRGVVFNDRGHILMVREKIDGKWSLPGGWADLGDSPAEAVVREIREEAGYIATASRLLGIIDRHKSTQLPRAFYIYKIFMRCEIVERLQEFDNAETDRVDFFTFDNLPDLSTARNTYEQMQAISEFWHQPDKPPLFN
ncbi:NUDIX hydrolase [Synechococcus sp. PCC 7336]|uniref:NUDIX hydrolase n=1 Tax=Synechococcus sp. PCC 7336 TaxID=195250 RepID=UPI0003451B5A|nr:NUDIX hydrolase [Synechococcus sp. PCC 7336]